MTPALSAEAANNIQIQKMHAYILKLHIQYYDSETEGSCFQINTRHPHMDTTIQKQKIHAFKLKLHIHLCTL